MAASVASLPLPTQKTRLSPGGASATTRRDSASNGSVTKRTVCA